MKLFQTRKPRPFNHKLIYSDERDERLKDIEQRARQELGLSKPEAIDRKRERLRFNDRKEHRPLTPHSLSSTVGLAVALIVLVFVMCYLLTGQWPV